MQIYSHMRNFGALSAFMKHILVTGAAGFIGFHTTISLIQSGYKVTGIDSLNNYYDPGLKIKRLQQCGINELDIKSSTYAQSGLFPEYRFMKMNVGDKDQMRMLFAQNTFDSIIHLAAQPGARYSVDHPGSYIDNNIIGFLNILEACRSAKPSHLVYASSSSVYGNNDQVPYSENDMVDKPASLYAATKKSNELMAYAYSHLYQIPMTGLRFFTVYGPWGRPDMVYFKYTKSILNNEPVQVYNNGQMKRDFTFIDDIVKGITGVLQIIPDDPVPHRIFNIGNSSPVELLYFIEVLEKILGKKSEKVMLPMQKGDVLTTFADTAKLEAYCGYKPSTPLEMGLKKFTDWYLRDY